MFHSSRTALCLLAATGILHCAHAAEPVLRKAYEDDFLVGVALNTRMVNGQNAKAGELAGTPNVLELTWDRDHMRNLWRAAAEAGVLGEDLPDIETDTESFGSSADEITTRVDVSGFLDRKRASMEAHASQVQDTGWLLALPPEVFGQVVGQEWYIRRGAPAGHHDDDVFAGLPAEAR